MVKLTVQRGMMNLTVMITSFQTCFTSTLTRLPRAVAMQQGKADNLYKVSPILSELDRNGMPDQWRCKAVALLLGKVVPVPSKLDRSGKPGSWGYEGVIKN